MSGWQRIGIVISVIWLIAAPIYIMADQNRRASDIYGMCFETAYRRYGPAGYEPKPAEFTIAKQQCAETLEKLDMPPSKLWDALMGQDKDSGDLRALIFRPLALFWIIGAAVISTFRWVRRGF
jgi:hypothetical protein